MHCDYWETWQHTWSGVGLYVVVQITLEADECEDASAITYVASVLAGYIPYVGWLVEHQLEAASDQIVSKNQGFGVIVTQNLPAAGVGIATIDVKSRRQAEATYSFTGTFTDLRVGDYKEIQTQDFLDDGWLRMPVDLNMGAGGDYLYFEVRPGENSPISEIQFQHGATKSLPAPPGFQQIPIDLNKGAKGDYIYVSFSRQAAPLGGLLVYASSDKYCAAPAGWSKNDLDLNAGAGGLFIHLCYQRQTTKNVPPRFVPPTEIARIPPGSFEFKPLRPMLRSSTKPRSLARQTVTVAQPKAKATRLPKR